MIFVAFGFLVLTALILGIAAAIGYISGRTAQKKNSTDAPDA